jgi:hypothetical protein
MGIVTPNADHRRFGSSSRATAGWGASFAALGFLIACSEDGILLEFEEGPAGTGGETGAVAETRAEPVEPPGESTRRTEPEAELPASCPLEPCFDDSELMPLELLGSAVPCARPRWARRMPARPVSVRALDQT